MINPQILFEDEYMLAIEKPSGVVVNNANSVNGETVEDWIREKYRIPNIEYRNNKKQIQIRENSNNKNTFLERAGIVHRLDRETSGILLIAKNEVLFEKMTQMFKERKIHKKYLALVHGETESSGMLNFKIARHDKKGKFVVAEGRTGGIEGRDGIEGKDSLTEFKLISRFLFNEKALNDFLRKNYERLKEKYDLKNYSLVEITLHTGRTHQIRVHFAHIRHPVAGDKLYGWYKVAKFERLWCPRQFLHAAEISFTHPVTEEEIVLKSEMPEELRGVLNHYLLSVV